MRLLIVGAGATGGFFGVKLARAGRDVTFLVRPERVAVLREHGLRISGPGMDDRITPRLTTAAEIDGSYDLILLTVKATALDQAMEDIAPAVGPDTSIIPILNGMDHLDRLNSRFGRDTVLGGVALVATSVRGPGDILVLSPDASLTIGDQEGAVTPRTERARAFLADAGFDAKATDAILAAMWSKWVFIAGAGAITCLMRGTIGDVAAVPGGTAWARDVLTEAADIAAAAGFPVAESERGRYEGTLTQSHSPYAPSFYRDMIKGHPVEVEHVFGDLSRRAAELAVASPFLDLATMNLRVFQHQLDSHSG
ncbi:2-dehydropantoate 2-reductase [Streptomyces polygonati]|uniref:2-dehydropantoate 2-reductase n=1 Tax=Streptomyces polygonati TaxID=1617087 RepID=A0ABV8HY86_9ACTN